MKISYNWLKEFINTSVSIDKIAELLTDSGLEVEGVSKIDAVEGGLEGLIIGEVISKEKHPDADKLSLTQVNIGDAVLPIVCGAPNVDKGQKVVVATVGATLYPVSGDSFKIKKSKIRGEVSEGMICAEDEIGLGQGHEGIMVLDENAQIGATAASYFQLESDYVIEIGLTPNRADAMSHFGVARDLFALLKRHNLSVSESKVSFPKQELKQTSNTDFKVEVLAEEACLRYAGVCIEGLELKASPEWLQNRLRSIGLSPINNVVDATNYVLHGLGQPLHAFDLAKIKGNKVVVRMADEGKSFKTLDGVSRKLHADDLMICSASEEMCIAGVFGGQHSGVTSDTNSIFLESAYFHPVYVRKTAKRHGLNTDASFRFERGIDPTITVEALKFAANLITEIAGGTVCSAIFDSNPDIAKYHEVSFDYSAFVRFAGMKISEEEVKDILANLDIKVDAVAADEWNLKVPSYRVDVLRAVDIAEEILRIYGYNQIPFPGKHHFSVSNAQDFEVERFKDQFSDIIASLGFNEIMANSLTSAGYFQLAGAWKSDESVQILNPLSSELGVLRQHMLFSGLECIAYNQNRQESNLKIFEFGKTYQKQNDAYSETEFFTLFVTGNQQKELWNAKTERTNFFYLKGYVEAILEKVGFSVDDLKQEVSESEIFTNQLRFSLGNIPLVKMGKVKKHLTAHFDIREDVFFAEILWENILNFRRKLKVKFKPLAKFPSVRRDLSLLLDKSISFQDLMNLARKQDRKLLKQVSLFDVYEGKNLDANKKSYGISFVFRDEDKTLNDKMIEESMDRILKSFEKEFKAELR